MSALDHLNFEDSYFLGITASGKHLRLRALFALTPDHPRYATPHDGDKHRYLEGDVLVEGLQIVAFSKGNPALLTDPDGTLDLGSIEFSQHGDLYHVSTEWFDLQFKATAVSVTLD